MRHDPQELANGVRDRLVENDAVRRLGVEVLWMIAGPATVTVRARHHDRVVTLDHPVEWTGILVDDLTRELTGELIAEALSNARPSLPPATWRRGSPRPSASW